MLEGEKHYRGKLKPRKGVRMAWVVGSLQLLSDWSVKDLT